MLFVSVFDVSVSLSLFRIRSLSMGALSLDCSDTAFVYMPVTYIVRDNSVIAVILNLTQVFSVLSLIDSLHMYGKTTLESNEFLFFAIMNWQWVVLFSICMHSLPVSLSLLCKDTQSIQRIFAEVLILSLKNVYIKSEIDFGHFAAQTNWNEMASMFAYWIAQSKSGGKCAKCQQ